MTQPRRVLPGATYLITRRATQRQHLLAPRRRTAQVVGYCLAVAAERHGVLVHGYTVMSNHYHAVVTDTQGAISAFLQLLHGLVARCLNAFLERWENLWSSDKPSVVRLIEPRDVLRKLVYTLVNPVSAGLVRSHDRWPGLRSSPGGYAAPARRFTRPRKLFRHKGPMPACAELPLKVPPGYGELTREAFGVLLHEAVVAREREVQEEMEREGRAFLGVDAVKRQRQVPRQGTRAPRRQRDPAIACRNKTRRVAELGELVTFRQHYAEARRGWRDGDRDVCFPAGTYQVVQEHGARCHPPPTPPAA